MDKNVEEFVKQMIYDKDKREVMRQLDEIVDSEICIYMLIIIIGIMGLRYQEKLFIKTVVN